MIVTVACSRNIELYVSRLFIKKNAYSILNVFDYNALHGKFNIYNALPGGYPPHTYTTQHNTRMDKAICWCCSAPQKYYPTQFMT